ncbi:hypothetical protein N2152v2_000396 [Parachlorella kessleri]
MPGSTGSGRRDTATSSHSQPVQHGQPPPPPPPQQQHSQLAQQQVHRSGSEQPHPQGATVATPNSAAAGEWQQPTYRGQLLRPAVPVAAAASSVERPSQQPHGAQQAQQQMPRVASGSVEYLRPGSSRTSAEVASLPDVEPGVVPRAPTLLDGSKQQELQLRQQRQHLQAVGHLRPSSAAGPGLSVVPRPQPHRESQHQPVGTAHTGAPAAPALAQQQGQQPGVPPLSLAREAHLLQQLLTPPAARRSRSWEEAEEEGSGQVAGDGQRSGSRRQRRRLGELGMDESFPAVSLAPAVEPLPASPAASLSTPAAIAPAPLPATPAGLLGLLGQGPTGPAGVAGTAQQGRLVEQVVAQLQRESAGPEGKAGAAASDVYLGFYPGAGASGRAAGGMHTSSSREEAAGSPADITPRLGGLLHTLARRQQLAQQAQQQGAGPPLRLALGPNQPTGAMLAPTAGVTASRTATAGPPAAAAAVAARTAAGPGLRAAHSGLLQQGTPALPMWLHVRPVESLEGLGQAAQQLGSGFVPVSLPLLRLLHRVCVYAVDRATREVTAEQAQQEARPGGEAGATLMEGHSLQSTIFSQALPTLASEGGRRPSQDLPAAGLHGQEQAEGPSQPATALQQRLLQHLAMLASQELAQPAVQEQQRRQLQQQRGQQPSPEQQQQHAQQAQQGSLLQQLAAVAAAVPSTDTSPVEQPPQEVTEGTQSAAEVLLRLLQEQLPPSAAEAGLQGHQGLKSTGPALGDPREGQRQAQAVPEAQQAHHTQQAQHAQQQPKLGPQPRQPGGLGRPEQAAVASLAPDKVKPQPAEGGLKHASTGTGIGEKPATDRLLTALQQEQRRWEVAQGQAGSQATLQAQQQQQQQQPPRSVLGSEGLQQPHQHQQRPQPVQESGGRRQQHPQLADLQRMVREGERGRQGQASHVEASLLALLLPGLQRRPEPGK